MRRQADASTSLRVFFGWRLRHWRQIVGLTQTQLARHLGYDQSHISKVESGERWPPPDLPSRTDQLLGTGGELANLWPLVERERHLALPQQRRGTDSTALPSTDDVPPSRWPGPEAVTALRQLLQAHRAAGEAIGGRFMISAMEHYARTIVQWQSTAPATAVNILLALAAEYAEMAGWARFDNTDYAMALYWYTCGQQWATLAGEHHLASRLLARQSSVHWTTGDAASAVALGEAARNAADIGASGLAWVASAV